MDEKELECLKHEYSELNENLRHYSTLRFAIFTVYFAVVGGIVAVAFGVIKAEAPTPFNINLMAKIGGLLFTLVFFSYEYRLEAIIEAKMKVGRELERKLGYTQISSRPSFRIINAANITRLLYVLMILFWLVAIFGKA